MHRRVIDAGGGEVAVIGSVVAGIRMIRRDIDRIRCHRYTVWERDLLPTRGGLVRERRSRKAIDRLVLHRFPTCVPVFVAPL